MRDELRGVVDEAMSDRGNPDAVLAAIDGAIRKKAVAAKRAVEAESAEGDMESEKTPGVTLVVTEEGMEGLIQSANLQASSFKVVDGGFQVEFSEGAYIAPSPRAEKRRVTIFRRAIFGNGGQQKTDAVNLPVSEVVRVESRGGQRWSNVEMAGGN